MAKINQLDMSYTQNRELSWMEFNRRVLEEGMDPRVPLLERLKFISIFTSNLDEFFMVRVGSFTHMTELKRTVIDNKSGWTAQEQLDRIFERMPQLYQERDAAFAEVEEGLRAFDVIRLTPETATHHEMAYINEYYQTKILPILSPIVLDARHPFPHLVNKILYLYASLEAIPETEQETAKTTKSKVSKGGKAEKPPKEDIFYGIVGIPSVLPPAIFLPNSAHYMLLETLLLSKLDELFEGFRLQNRAVISVTRNADIAWDDVDEISDNIRSQMKKALKKRSRLSPVRLEVQGALSAQTIAYLTGKHGITPAQLYHSTAPLRMKYIFSIEGHIDPTVRQRVCYRAFDPQPSPSFDLTKPIAPQIQAGDKLLHFPYESMDPFLQLLREAANDPTVISIKITIYRMASISKVAEYLIQAAENGKEVLALLELRARFDEENNIDYSERLEAAGCTIMYGFEEYKVHSKICLITRFVDGKLQYITQIGTGNYNEKTAKQYADFSLMTASEEIGIDATAFFKNMLISNLDGTYRHLKVAPFGIRPMLMNAIDREIAKVRRGEPGEILIKCNSVTERGIIDKLEEASTAGVRITLIVRGICCILPAIPGKTENIRVITIVGRFLEHHRVYAFGADRAELYISSADLMTRNLTRRVELAVPLYDPEVRTTINEMLDTILEDTEKAKELLPDGSYRRVEGDTGVDCQRTFMIRAMERAEANKAKRHKPASVAREAAKEARRAAPADRSQREDATARPAHAAVSKAPKKKPQGLFARLHQFFFGRE